MVCFEWWTFEISTIVAGAVDELQLAVNTVLMQFGMINFAVRWDRDREGEGDRERERERGRERGREGQREREGERGGRERQND